MTLTCKINHAVITIALGSIFLAGCFFDKFNDVQGRNKAAQKLPYELYLSGTLISWAQDDKTRFNFDEAKGIYYLDNVKAGQASNIDPRRFKITGENWKHQFGFGPDTAETNIKDTTLAFANNEVTATLKYLVDSKDIYIPLAGDQKNNSNELLLDFRVRVLDSSDTPKVELSVIQDVPPLSNHLILTSGKGEQAKLKYVGDNIYSGSLRLDKGANNLALVDESGTFYNSKNQLTPGVNYLQRCIGKCSSSIAVADEYLYNLELSVDEERNPNLSLRKMNYDEAKVASPHFDANNSIYVQKYPPYARDPFGKVETVKASSRIHTAGNRIFTVTSTQDQRDDKPQYRFIKEYSDLPQVHTGDLLFDALFALAIDDMKLNSVNAIKDGNYNHGRAIACDCFETGEKWNYVWTRDLSYAADLSLVNFDPQRVINSLLFKTSDFRSGVEIPYGLPANSKQIIQDTGSGGSWPVSTDRVTWAVAAESVINNLTGEERSRFIETAFAALRGTVEADRRAAFDTREGLYGGEQSYLDWRVQTYAPWITNNLSRMSESKALSTNVAHYQALSLTAKLARMKSENELAKKYQLWANELKQKINEKFWLKDVGLYSSLTTAAEDHAPLYKYDMLGTALAVRYGVASQEQARQVMENYPHAEFGVPVYYPQQPNMYVYHNRALWPFVTAYALRAGAQVQNTKAVNNAIHSLMRGAALNLSNMENLEWLTAKPWYDDGPAINSRRQLWSIAAYLGMVTETVFGYQVVGEGIKINPFLTGYTRSLLGDNEQAILKNIIYKNKAVSVQLHLPERQDVEGFYPVKEVLLNGKPLKGLITEAMLTEGNNIISVHFKKFKPTYSKITLVPKVDPLSHVDPKVFSPSVPEVNNISPNGNKLALQFADEGNKQIDASDLRYNIYRDGKLVGANIKTTSWVDPEAFSPTRRYCYAVEAVFISSGNRSLHSEPQCYEKEAARFIAVTDPRVETNVGIILASEVLTKPVVFEWGKPKDKLKVNDLIIDQSGIYAFQILYNNRQHTIDSGVSNAVKQIIISDRAGAEVARGVVQMPNVEDRANKHPLRTSTQFIVQLNPGIYVLELEDYFNMSYLKSNSTYSGKGGMTGPVNSSSIAAFKIVRIN